MKTLFRILLADLNLIFDFDFENVNKTGVSRKIFAETLLLWYVRDVSILLQLPHSKSAMY